MNFDDMSLKELRELTWSGRGRKPKWVAEALDRGKQLDDLLIL